VRDNKFRQNILYIRKDLILVAKLEQRNEEIDKFLKKYLKMSKTLSCKA